MEDAREVLRQFGVEAASLDALGNRGGFSGASLWHCETLLGPLCLRAWPDFTTTKQLAFIHHLQQIAAGLPFVPRLFPTLTGPTWLEHRQRLWELTRWMPGRADFREHPSPARLTAACEALAQLHLVWSSRPPLTGPCPAIERRFEVIRQWQQFAPSLAPLDAAGRQAKRLVERWIAGVPALLAPWRGLTTALQPCLCDVWHDHVLFEGNRVSALLDYGETKLDHVAVDLARLLGSTIEDDEPSWSAGLTAYRRVRPLSDGEEALARVLDRSGAILGVANWLRWLYHERRPFDNREAALRRMGVLVARLERW